MPDETGERRMTGSNIEIAQRYLAAIEAGAFGDELAVFFDPDVVQDEFPNRLVPDGARRDLATILEGAVRGQAVLSGQTYEVLSAIESTDAVVLEDIWRGRLAFPVATLAPGDQMRARFAVFLEFRGGLIIKQRNYDCFDPF